jgi:hypothetical protein
MPEATLQNWIDYKGKLDAYRAAVDDYINNFGESPSVPKPPRPPQFNGWEGEEE